MFREFIAASILLAISVVIHAASLTAVLRWITGRVPPEGLGFLAGTWLLVRVAWWLILTHLLQIAVWGMFYFLMRCLPDLESSLYFSVVTYTTVGYGDLVLDREWRLVAGIEALTGILMCGLSTGLFFAMISKLRTLLRTAARPDSIQLSPP